MKQPLLTVISILYLILLPTSFKSNTPDKFSVDKDRIYSEGEPLSWREKHGRISWAAERELLTAARASLKAAVKMKDYDVSPPKNPELLKKHAVFVSVLNSLDQLELARAGTFSTERNLYEATIEAARMCAAAEASQAGKRLDDLWAIRGEIEVAVIKNSRRVDSWEEVQKGQGVAITSGDKHAMVIPITALSRSWSAEDMLAFACKRAGLPPDAYRSGEVDIIVFEAVVYADR